jgi:hypothetical protein
MRLMMLAALTTVVASTMTMIGCASEDSEKADNGNSALEEPTVANPIGACNGRKECVDAVVLKALFSSTKTIKNGFYSPPEGEPVNEFVARWLGVTETKGTIAIKTTPRADNETAVEISLLDSDPVTESGCTIRFTLAGDRIAETELDAICAG